MTGRAGDVQDVVDAVLGRAEPLVVGVSGFGGAGKSTLAEQLHRMLPGSTVVPADEFLRQRPPVTRSTDWSDVDRERLRDQVLAPARSGAPVRYQVWDHQLAAPGPWVDVAVPGCLIVEGLGLFTPDLVGFFDLRVWVDTDLDTATAQGRWRDQHVYGNPQTELWLGVWKPNDADFFERFRPDLSADLLVRPGERSI